jgi:hypothetical protein
MLKEGRRIEETKKRGRKERERKEREKGRGTIQIELNFAKKII